LEIKTCRCHSSLIETGEQTADQKAERLLKAELEKQGWKEQSLTRFQKPSAKIQLARLFRKESTMSPKWIAQRLQMGSWPSVSNLLNAKPNTPYVNQDLPPLDQ